MIKIVNRHATSEGEYIGRGSPLGNPYPIKDGVTSRARAISLYKVWLLDQIERNNPVVVRELQRLLEIAQKGDLSLKCYCAPKACHGDFIKELLESKLNKEPHMHKTKIYTGIGSRETPPDILQIMYNIGFTLAERGWTLRSGHAPGADTAFEEGAKKAQGKMEIYLPWNGFNGAPEGNPSYITIHGVQAKEAEKVAAMFHPNWAACNHSAARALHTRNVYQVAGPSQDIASELIICWTKGGKGEGGTGQALRMAKHLELPIFDLAVCTQEDILSFLNHGVTNCEGCGFHG